MLPPRPANAFFRFRINGKLIRLGTNKLIEAEWFAKGECTPDRIVEIIDAVTGSLVKRYPER